MNPTQYDMPQQWHNYIDGQWLQGDAGWLSVYSPIDNQKLTEMAVSGRADVERAIIAARRAFDSQQLAAMRPVERCRMVRKMGDYLLANRDQIAWVLTMETGKPLSESRGEIEGAARYFEYYANIGETLDGRSIPLGENYVDYTVYEPYGVTAHIVPWNFPVEMIARSVAPALVTGNTCVVKTPELTPLACTYLAHAAEFAGFEEGTFNILCGYGQDAGAQLSSHPDIDLIVFTGSVATGTHIATAAAKNLVPCVLELGGKSAAIVGPDADLEQVADSVRWGIYLNAGQVCSALSRLIVHQSRYQEVLDRLVSQAEQLTIGSGLDDPDMGSLVSLTQLEKVHQMCQQARADGAVAATGARRGSLEGCYYQPTLFTEVDNHMPIVHQEVFGPVLTLQSYSSDEQALQLANGTDYSLAAGVFTQDINRAMQLSRKLKAGQVYINEWYAGGVEAPFGGTGKSGYGREKGREGLLNYVNTKNVAIRL